jgi:hypothetical protein
MPNLNQLTALYLPTGSCLAADETDYRLSLSLEGQPLPALRLTRGPELHVQREVPLRAMFECGTVEELARYIDGLASVLSP